MVTNESGHSSTLLSFSLSGNQHKSNADARCERPILVIILFCLELRLLPISYLL